MRGYVPREMIRKQLRWEWVHTNLYRILERDNPFPNLRPTIAGLALAQERQIRELEKLAGAHGVDMPTGRARVQYRPFADAVDELLDREYQLLHEYESLKDYFLSGTPYVPGLHSLVDSQTEQVNALMQLKQAVQAGKRRQSEEAKPDYILEPGFRLERVASGLTFPTEIAFDDQGNRYVTESGYAYGTPPGKGRVLRIEEGGSTTEVAGGFGGPVTGIVWRNGDFYVAEGAIGEEHGKGCGQITKVYADGRRETIVTGLRTCGDHFTGDVEVGPDGRLYFSVGTATNSAVIGTDNAAWLKLHPGFHDVPAADTVLNGINFISPNPLSEQREPVVTGAYKPVGVPSRDGETIGGSLLANGVIYSCNPDGSDLRVVAHGLRNPFGLKFSPFNGNMYITDNGADPRGSRQIRQDWDNFWEIAPGGWYGFPDFFSGLPATQPHFHMYDQAKPTFLLKRHPELAGQPLVRFQPHSASHKFDFCTNEAFGRPGDIYVAQLGASRSEPGEKLTGYKVVRADPATGQIFDFLVNRKGETNTAGPIRPVAAKFGPRGDELYVVDFGMLSKPQPGTGSLWRIVRSR
ncbi:PQQ-dependent sugar dehydrogenase [Paenibacillus sp. GYB003]|uniref:PQQ-dependent sugar dehydrogenase n=1 Tax=Paenibacillus sp. GYB003 TaxID=2994392 RepID=UPI002F964154